MSAFCPPPFVRFRQAPIGVRVIALPSSVTARDRTQPCPNVAISARILAVSVCQVVSRPVSEELNANGDEVMEGAIHQAMIGDKRLSAQVIRVSVKNGIVRLEGSVQSYRRALAAVELAASWPGVRDVINGRIVEPVGSLTDAEVAENVRAALESSEDVVKDAITVSVEGGVAILQGSVGDAWQYAIAEDVARSARGVRDVRNLLVAHLTDLINDEETAHEIQQAVGRLCGHSIDTVRVAVNGSTVVLSGTVATLPQKEALRDVVRRFGLLDVQNEVQVVPRHG